MWIWRETILFCFHLSTWKNDVAIYKDKKDCVEQFQDKGIFEFGFGSLEMPITSS